MNKSPTSVANKATVPGGDATPSGGNDAAPPTTAQALTLELEVEAGQWPLSSVELEALVGRAATALAGAVALPTAMSTATVVLTSDAQVRGLNARWRGRDNPTNVLSFPSRSPTVEGQPVFLGDVILAEGTVRREAAELRLPLSHHVQHLVLHGLLHLLGFDHETSADAMDMEGLEARVLAKLGVADPYAGTEPVTANRPCVSVTAADPGSPQDPQ